MRTALAILGGGNMAQAIVRGGLRAGVLERGRVVVAEVDGARREVVAREGVEVRASAREAMVWLRERGDGAGGARGQVLLAVKPQSLAGLAGELAGEFAAVGARRIVITILAGTASGRVRELLGEGARVVRAMPNLAAGIGQGATAVCRGEGAAEGDDAFAMELFRGVGPLVVSIGEELMDAFTAVAGSGPAYLLYLAEAMMRGAREVGFDEAMADAVVRQTLRGAAELLAGTGGSAAEMRGAVTSKGGTTEAALGVLEEARVMEAVVRAIGAARERARGMGKEKG